MPGDSFKYLTDLLRAYRKSEVLFSAFELGVFDKISSKPAESNILAKDLNISEKGLLRLLSALCAMGFIKKENKKYCLSENFEAYLNPLSSDNISGLINHEIHLHQRWNLLTKSIQSGSPVKKVNEPLEPADTDRFIKAMANIGHRSAPIFLQRIEFQGKEKLLDLAGGPGIYIARLSDMYPEMQLTLFDQSDTIEIAKKSLSDHRNIKHMSFIAGDIFVDDIGDSYDVIFSSNVIHIFGPNEVNTIFDKCYSALKPGGRLLIKDFFLNEDYTGPEFSALFSLHMLLSTEGGKCYSEQDMISLMKESNFSYKQSIKLTESSLVIESIK
jgi:ubiquinone/menaquinone biosynthesis C-methylase UbiE